MVIATLYVDSLPIFATLYMLRTQSVSSYHRIATSRVAEFATSFVTIQGCYNACLCCLTVSHSTMPSFALKLHWLYIKSVFLSFETADSCEQSDTEEEHVKVRFYINFGWRKIHLAIHVCTRMYFVSIIILSFLEMALKDIHTAVRLK